MNSSLNQTFGQNLMFGKKYSETKCSLKLKKKGKI